MFSISNIYTKLSTTVVVANGEDNIEFIISSIISKRNKDELNDPNQFLLLNAYLDYKGPDFKAELFRRYQQVSEDILMTATRHSIVPLPLEITNPILDMLELDDIYNYVKNVYGLQAPSNLATEFNQMIVNDGRGTREQTYIKDDYLKLASLCLIIKAIIGPVGQFAHIKQRDVGTEHKEYILFQFIKRHKIFHSDPMVKLLSFIEKSVNSSITTDETNSIRAIEKKLPREEIPTFVLSVVVLQKIPVACLVDDNADRNVITKIYNYVNNKLKATGDVTKTIRNKTSLTDVESGSGDKESTIESTRIIEDIAVANLIEMDWSINSPEKIVFQMPPRNKELINPEVLQDAIHFTKVFNTAPINRCQIDILAFIFKIVIDPRSLDYVSISSIVNLMAVGFAYLWGLNFKSLALLLVAQQDTTNERSMSINITTNKSRIPVETKDELSKYYPHNRVINEETSNNLVEETIGNLVNELYDIKWIHTADEKYILEVYKDRSSGNILPQDLKIQLANFIIKHEQLRE